MVAEPEEPEEPDRAALARATALSVAQGKVKLADVWRALVGAPDVTEDRPDRTPAQPKPLTDVERVALVRLPEVYGKVHPEEVRLLTRVEQADIIEEREIIDVILALLKKRKDESIREVIANHLDLVAEAEMDVEDLATTPVDAKGHLQTKQDVPVPGTGKKFQKTVSDPKPALTSAGVQQAYADGVIDRKTYLSLTTLPEVERQLDETKLTRAIKADPNLLWVLSEYTTTSAKVTTIKVQNDT